MLHLDRYNATITSDRYPFTINYDRYHATVSLWPWLRRDRYTGSYTVAPFVL